MSISKVLSLIGNTPMVKVEHIDTGLCELFLKLENQNPGGSIKDRIALTMIEDAERSGHLKSGDTIVEATAGNTGLALALVAQQKGYRMIAVVFDKVSQEKIFHLKSMGVEVIITRSDVTHGHPDYYQDKAEALAKANPHMFYINQFANPSNPEAHERLTAPELWEQMDHRVDAIVCGVGTGGTLTGLGRFFKRVSPKTEMVMADPKGSTLAPFFHTGTMIKAGSWLVEGIGQDFVPVNCDISLVKHAYTIPDDESITTGRNVLLKEGILCGSSSGTLIAAALRYCREQKSPKRVVTFVCDSGNKYLSKMYNPYWLQDNGITEIAEMHDLRDLIARPYLQGKVVSVAPNDTLHQVYAQMKMHEVSQVPVMEDGHIIGLMNETQLLLAVLGNPKGFTIHAGAVMEKKPPTIEVTQSMTDLLPIFEKNHAACVLDKGQFLGLVTPIDFLNYLRKRAG
jgi:cystathionine beta-synthase